jgi:hypothetical protein
MIPETLEVVRHDVKCPYCSEKFELFSAKWCSHWPVGAQSKQCPRCMRCLCRHPSYKNPRMWMDAPGAFRKRGFPRLFLLYL